MKKIAQMELMGEYRGYKVYKNSDGVLEGWKQVGKMRKDTNTMTDLKRVLTNAKTIEGFEKYINGLRNKPKPKQAEMPKLFEE